MIGTVNQSDECCTGLGDVGTTVAGTGTSIGSGLLTAGAIAGGPTNPVGIGLMIAGGAVMLGSAMLHVFGVGVRNPYEDKDVKTLNELEVTLQQNLAWWDNSDRSTASKQQAVGVASQVLSVLPQLCNDPGLGANWANGCINDRKRGGKYDWYALYYDPIANATVSDAGFSSMVTGLVGGPNVVYVAGGLVVLGLLLTSKD